MKNERTLIILTPGFPANEEDTTCLPPVQTLIRALNEEDPDLKIIIVAFQYPFFDGIYHWYDNEVISINGRGRGRLYRLHTWTKAWQKLKKINKTDGVLGLLSFWCTECALIGSNFGKRYRLKHFTWIKGQDARKSNKYVKRIRPKKNELVAISDFIKKEFYKNHGIAPQHVIPLGIDRKLFQEKPVERDLDILGVGSLIPLKQYDVFVEVVNEIADRVPTIRTMICGKGPEEQRLKNLIDSLSLQSNIFLKGETPHAEVLKLMQRTRIFLHTSNYEGFGQVYLEALYAGAHLVSFTRPMDKSIPNWHHVNSKEEMVDKVRALLSDPELKNERVFPYSSEDLAKAMLHLFEND